MAAALFGGFCVTGTIARTATNIRAGAHGPVAGIMHAVFVLIAFLALMPLAGHIPFAALAGILMVVAWGMIERHEITLVATGARVQALAMVVTLALVVLVDLTTGIAMGCLVAALGTWIRRPPQIARKLPD
jgi:SulP family sulfate permease